MLWHLRVVVVIKPRQLLVGDLAKDGHLDPIERRVVNPQILWHTGHRTIRKDSSKDSLALNFRLFETSTIVGETGIYGFLHVLLYPIDYLLAMEHQIIGQRLLQIVSLGLVVVGLEIRFRTPADVLALCVEGRHQFVENGVIFVRDEGCTKNGKSLALFHVIFLWKIDRSFNN